MMLTRASDRLVSRGLPHHPQGPPENAPAPPPVHPRECGPPLLLALLVPSLGLCHWQGLGSLPTGTSLGTGREGSLVSASTPTAGVPLAGKLASHPSLLQRVWFLSSGAQAGKGAAGRRGLASGARAAGWRGSRVHQTPGPRSPEPSPLQSRRAAHQTTGWFQKGHVLCSSHRDPGDRSCHRRHLEGSGKRAEGPPLPQPGGPQSHADAWGVPEKIRGGHATKKTRCKCFTV